MKPRSRLLSALQNPINLSPVLLHDLDPNPRNRQQLCRAQRPLLRNRQQRLISKDAKRRYAAPPRLFYTPLTKGFFQSCRRRPSLAPAFSRRPRPLFLRCPLLFALGYRSRSRFVL